MKQNQSWGSGLSPFFIPEDFLPSHPFVKDDLQTEILVIGGGISGLLCAYELLKAGRQVTLVTSNTVGDGACRFSNGIISGDGGPDLLRLRELIGMPAAVSWYRLAAAAVEQTEKILEDTGSKCDFQRRDQFYYTSSRSQANLLREEYYLRRHIGLDCQWMPEDQCREEFSFPGTGGILMKQGGAELNPVKFCRDLADWITLHGGRIFEGSRIDSIESKNSGFLCRCGQHTVKAEQVIDARGGEVLQKRPSLGQKVTVFSVVTEPISEFHGWKEGCLIKSNDSLFYLRKTPDGRIIATGEASSALSPQGRIGKMDAHALCRVKYRNLTEEVREMFYGIPRIKQEYGFCQGMVFPKKGLPFLGKDPQWEGMYYLYAFGESGMAGAVLGSAWIRRMICENDVRVPAYLSL